MTTLTVRCAAASLALFLAACTGTPTVDTSDPSKSIDGRLYPVKGASQDLVYVDPTADFARYDRVLLAPLAVDGVHIIQPDQSGGWRHQRPWELTDSDRAWLQDTFRDALERELVAQGGYTLSDSAGHDVLLIEAKLTEIAPKAAKDDLRSRQPGRSTVYSEGSGSLSVAVAFADSQSGEVLALSKDRRNSSNQWGVNNRVTNQAEVRRVFSAWARQLRVGLDRLKGRGQEEN